MNEVTRRKRQKSKDIKQILKIKILKNQNSINKTGEF